MGEFTEKVLFDPSMRRLMYGIKDSIKRQTIIAHNLSNAAVEGYKPIRFADELEEIMSRPGFIEDKIIEEEEMAKMTKNRFKYSTYMRLMNMKIDTLKKVINQGKIH